MQGMTAEMLSDLIRKHGVERIGPAVRGQLPAEMLGEGWDLTNWRVSVAPGAVLFYQIRDRMTTAERRILVINAPEADRMNWAREIAGESDAPLTLILQARGVACR